MRSDLLPKRIRFGATQFVHRGGLLFAGAPADFGADCIGRQIPDRAMQPARQNGTLHELPGILRQRNESALREVFRQVRVANNAQRRRIDEINMAPHQISKRCLRSSLNVITQEPLMLHIVHPWIVTAAAKIGQEQTKTVFAPPLHYSYYSTTPASISLSRAERQNAL